VIKLILRKGKSLIGQFLVYNSLEVDFKLFQVKKSPSCPLCNEEPKIKELADYHEVCSVSGMTQATV
jgi:adenylyltransferase/sulfurtransferase